MKKSSGLLVVLIFLLSGCYHYFLDKAELVEVIKCNVPLSYGEYNTTETTVNIIEKDKYGRVLFSYTSNTDLKYTEIVSIETLAIAQIYQFRNVYYYDDFCWIAAESFDKFTEADYEKLKELNDWNKPLDESKMTRQYLDRASAYEMADYLRIENFAGGFFSTLSENDVGYSLNYKDSDKTQKLFFESSVYEKIYTGEVYTYENDYGDVFTFKYFDHKVIGTYLMIVNIDGTFDENNYIEKIEDVYNCQQQVHDFKIKNGWTFE